MCGLYKVICVLACLLVIPATAQTQQGSVAKCRNPAGLEGDIYNNYCTQFTCTKAKKKFGIWVERPNIDDCCFHQGTGYQMGDVIDVTVTNCTETSLVCERREGLATIVACSACNCFQEILMKLDENGQQIDEIKTEVIENGDQMEQIVGDIQEDCAWNHTYLKGRPIEGGRVEDVPSWYECKQLCAFNPECESFTWNYWPYVCYLMSTVPDEAHTGLSEGTIAGIKSCWEQSSGLPDLWMPECGAGWVFFKGECFKYFSEEKTWQDAEDQCVTEEAHLASINSEESEHFIVWLNGGSGFPWLGGRRDPENRETWLWSGLGPWAWTYTNWAEGQPDDIAGEEDCIHISDVNHWDNVNGLWYDAPCTSEKPFVCKKMFNFQN